MTDVLVEMATTLTTEFELQTILDRLVRQVVEVIPVSAVGVTLVGPGPVPRHVAASSPAALRWEQLQSELGEGPCVLASRTNTAVLVPDLRADDQFPHFGAAAAADGLAAVFTFPLRQGDATMGALDLYEWRPGSFDADMLATAQTLADVAAAYLANAAGRAEAERTLRELEHELHHDALTGLASRSLLQDRLERLGADAQPGVRSAVLFLDVDGFKTVNDTHGHTTGDALLVEIAQRLRRAVRPGDTLARASGDEFIVLCPALTTPGSLRALVARVAAAFTTPFLVADVPGGIRVDASIGVAHTGAGAGTGATLVRAADRAMYLAKRSPGTDHRVVDVRDLDHRPDGSTLATDLRDALRSGGLDLAYQPVVRCADGVVTGVEALLRWRHPTLGQVDPQTAVTAAEASGLIIGLGTWVLDRACRDHARWRAAHPHQDVSVAVNVSARQVVEPGFAAVVAEVLDRTRTPPGSLVLEVTETVLLEDDPATTRVLAELGELGVALALDDFGTGYAALGYLRRLPLDVIKVDRSVTAATSTGRGDAVLRAVVDLAHAVGASVVLEGVETAQQAEVARGSGCDAAQGYFYARPGPAEEIAALLAEDGAPTLPERG